MGSTRLPGKVLMPLGDKTVLGHVITRCKKIAADVVCVATTGLPGDVAVIEEATLYGVRTHRGPTANVLGRYYGAAVELGADEIVRITADCPLINPSVCNEVIQLREAMGVPYASNNYPTWTFPRGLDCEVFTFGLLEEAHTEATNPYDREHVTPWMRRGHTTHLDGPALGHHRWTIDTPEDYALLRLLYG